MRKPHSLSYGWQDQDGGSVSQGWLNSSRMHGTVSAATSWARMHSLKFDHPRVDPTHHNFCFSTNPHAGVSQACESNPPNVLQEQ